MSQQLQHERNERLPHDVQDVNCINHVDLMYVMCYISINMKQL